MFRNVLFTQVDVVDDFSHISQEQEKIQIHNAFVSEVAHPQQETEDIDVLVEEYATQHKYAMLSDSSDSKSSVLDDVQTTEEYLEETKNQQLFDFNLLPPTDRLIISKIGIDVPVIDSKVNNINSFTSKDFDPYLMSGVVKYPTTPAPWSNGNTFIFGHTSQEWWMKNAYGTVFAKIPQLEQWDEITVIWEWKRYTYHIVAKEIVYPKWVEAVYQKYQKIDKDYLTLMGCYPIGSSSKRIMVIAERR